MQLVTGTKYRLSKNAAATQVILVCHGGWSSGDGYVYVPKGMLMKFYSAHGQFGTRTQSIAENLLGAQAQVSVDPATLARLMQDVASGRLTPDQLDQAILDAKAQANAGGIGESMQVYEEVRGQGLGNRQKVFNYSLSYKGPRDSEASMEALFNQHQGGTLAADIDMLVMQPGASGHLASAIAFALDKGGKYGAFHFLPCRWVDDKDKKAMRTVNLPKDFGGEAFIQTSVL
jgi:hypothetical protein